MTSGQMVTLFMKYYNSHGSIILECQNQLDCTVKKKKKPYFYHVYINMENKFPSMPKILPEN
jgi:hypothetical protein